MIILTIIGVVAIIGVFTRDRLEAMQGISLAEAQSARWTLPIIFVIALVLLAVWTWTLYRRRTLTSWLVRSLLVLSVIALLAAGSLSWWAATVRRDITIVTYRCDATVLMTTGRDPMDGCTPEGTATNVRLGTSDEPDTFTSTPTDDGQRAAFRDLPQGSWKATLTVDGTRDTVAVGVVADGPNGLKRVAGMDPYSGQQADQTRWATSLTFPHDVETFNVLFYESAEPVVPSASLRFNVFDCRDQNLESFDASNCTPATYSMPLVIEKIPEGAHTWRHPVTTMEGPVQVVSNLEAREYTFQPDLAGLNMQTQSTDILIIPTSSEQTINNTLTQPGAQDMTVTIASNTGPLQFNVYVFPRGSIYA